MTTLRIEDTAVEPWWVRAGVLWSGHVFARAILQPGDPAEGRIQALREEITHGPEGHEGYLSIQRARLFTRAYRQSEGEPPIIRRARAIHATLSEIAIPFSRYQLLAGSPNGDLLGTEVAPEFMAAWLTNEVELNGQRMSELDAIPLRRQCSFLLREEDRRELLEDILPYWRERSQGSRVVQELGRNFPDALHYLRFSQVYMPQVTNGLSHTIQDYASVLAVGLEGIKAGIEREMAALDAADPAGLGDFGRRNCYQAMKLCADGLIVYANRCADEAERLAALATDAGRAGELRELAAICRRVPAGPARTWWEAVQAWHLLHMATGLLEGGASHSAGRFDQYMLPYLERDLAAGTIDRRRAQELLECLFVKFNEAHTMPAYRGARGYAGMHANDKITIGGVDRHGRDATNELTYMLIEAHAHVHLSDPCLSLRVHRDTPDDLLRCALEVVRLGSGLPQIICDGALVPAMLRCGLLLEEARDYADIGCQENVSDPNMDGVTDTNGRTNAGWFNLVKPIELALHDGVNPLNGEQVGPRTGDARSFGTMAAFVAAVRAQMEYGVASNVLVNNVQDYSYANNYPMPYHDLMHPGPRRTGIDINNGGCKHNWTGGLAVGLATAGDSLAAIEWLIYRERSLTWDQLLRALADNWVGHDAIRRLCLAAPKYGADDDYADGWAKVVADLWLDAYARHHTPRGGRFVGGFISMGIFMVFGETTDASPDGRRRGEPLSDSTAPSAYAPVVGPAATHRSVARAVDGQRAPNGITFNQKMSLTSIASERDLARWGDLVRTFNDLGGVSVQYIVVNRDQLVEAQRHPERYRDLIVRVGGYSAAFTELSKEVQDYLIAMAEQQV